MPSIQSILKSYWGHENFRPLQEVIIQTVLKGDDCLALMPTGGGKSICFQVPAIAMEGVCLVITPLIALMRDQVENLRRRGITAFSVHSGMNRKEVLSTIKTAANSNCRFLYVSPERLETTIFREFLPSLEIKLIAVDEAHCISQWGYDFRPSYLRIAALREELPGVPVLALTASATREVQNDICEKLSFRSHKVFRQSFERPNLSYSVFKKSSRINKIIDILTKVNGTAIVYCRSRKKTKEISDLLNMKGIASDFYHAGLYQDERNEKQEAWLKDKTRVIVCTNAFGMGIDKPGVRVVVHADVPDCLENYYQEAGRAGRDGKRAYAVLLAADKELAGIEESAAKKFPSPDEIRKIYKALMNHLQIPAGAGEGNYYDLDATTFIKNFNLDAGNVVPALKTLEQEELLYFNDQVFIQSKIQVTAERDQLFEFEKMYPDLEPVIKTLLRTYEGIIDQPVNIFEKSISAAIGCSNDKTISHLNQLHRHGIINYIPRKEKPQVYLFQNRVKAEDLSINVQRYERRKKQFIDRAKAMVRYVTTTDMCRSVMIGKYFGDDELKPCGICDNCLQLKRTHLKAEEFERVSKNIMTELSSRSLSLHQLMEHIKPAPKEKIREVVDFLLSEQKIHVDDSGLISLKNTPFPAPSS